MKYERETRQDQLSREAWFSGWVQARCPGLGWHSRACKSALRTQVPRLRYDRSVALAWLWNLFLSAKEREIYRLALTITGADHSALDLRERYPDIEFHLYDGAYQREVERMAVEYQSITGRTAVVVVESEERIPHRRPMLRFALFVCAFVIVVVGFRLCSLLFVEHLFRHFP